MPVIYDMPFELYWSPRRDWFFINQMLGSGLKLPLVFEIKQGTLVEHGKHLVTGAKKARDISPCLPAADSGIWTAGDGLKWSKDGRRLAWQFRTRPDSCIRPGDDITGSIPPERQWRPFMMISDVATGEIVDGSIRMTGDSGDVSEKVRFPTDGPYRDF